ncbi:MAG TPA: OB-fold domain-containing protein [Sporichthyaceae bacterium]|nr:OB-fold domain-containing protein [Sporichthyaceae bacterium]
MIITDPLLHRPAPADDPLHAFFWRSGADGVLRMLRCADCGYWLHPPSPRCPQCLSAAVTPQPLSGWATVHTFTINVQPWTPGQDPYVYAIVELPEQVGLRLSTNVVGAAPEDVFIAQALQVAFVHRHDAYYPVFIPLTSAEDGAAP